jgi:3-hydroxy acid dehydrogenase/malonic semialdehyde reductase
MMSSRKATVALVTGASSGFGAAIAERFVRNGTKVIAVARRIDRLVKLKAELGERLIPLALDLTDRGALEREIGKLQAGLRPIDCLINNAGLALGLSSAADADLDDWDRMIDTNCRAVAHLTRLVLPAMIRRGHGDIVNIGSVAGTYPYPGGNVYGATKAFLHQFSLNLRSDLHGTGVRVTAIEPGICGGTEFSNVRFAGDRAKAAAVYDGMQPLMPEDIADLVAYAISAPRHVNLNRIEVMPTQQSFAPFAVARSG